MIGRRESRDKPGQLSEKEEKKKVQDGIVKTLHYEPRNRLGPSKIDVTSVKYSIVTS